MLKAHARPDMLKVVPIMWKELERVKSRVEDVSGAITGKVANQERMDEVKKQLLTNKRLKEYFKSNPKEKDIL